MSAEINSFFQFLEGRLGLQPASVSAIALAIVLVLALLSLFLLIRLRGARKVVSELGERLGYEPPHGDGEEILHEEYRKEILLRGKDVKIDQLEQRIKDLEAEGETKHADLTALQQRSKGLEEQLEQASLQIGKVTATTEQTHSYREAAEQLEQRIREMEAESSASLAALQRRTKELEDQLQQAVLQRDSISAQADEQAQASRAAVEQLEQRIRQMEAEGSAYLSALELRSKELEEQLRQASLQKDRVASQAGDQLQAYRATVEQLEQRLRQMEAEGGAYLSALELRSNELEEQLRQANLRNDEIVARANEQEQTHRKVLENLEQCFRDKESESSANLAGLQRRVEELEEKLQVAALRHEDVAAQSGEQLRSYRNTVDQLEQRVREVQAEGIANLAVLARRSKELEEQLQQAAIQNDAMKAQAGEQAQAHRSTVDQFEERVRQLEAEGSASLPAAKQRATELEEQLRQAAIQSENEKSIAHQVALEKNAGMERLELLIRDLRAENDAKESSLNTLHAQVGELENQLRQAVDRNIPEKAEVANAEVGSGDAVIGTDEQLLHRAEWITSRAVGAILPHGLVAAEAYASAALAANPHSKDAPQLLAELARIRRAFPGGLPSVTDSITTFDERAAAFLAVDLARAADIAEEEAQRRYRASLNRSALLAANLAIELRQQTTGENSPETVRLQELKSSLLARLGSNGGQSSEAPKLASS